MITVNKPFLPPQEEYTNHLNEIWKSNLLTNNGPKCQLLEEKLKEFLNVDNLLFVSNGTIALQFAIKALNLKGEIITTPFSYIATSSSIVWEGCKPIFVDIDTNSLNIDANKIESAINKRTSAILATHVYGNPCDVAKIQSIAEKYNLKVIYDGAHAFNVKIKNESIFNFGDISICSTHATKLFHTIEGGLIISKNKSLINKISFLRNFGHDGPDKFTEIGINGKNSEFHSSMGLVNLKYIQKIILKRKKISEAYDKRLKNLNLKKPIWHINSKSNYSYYPIIFPSEKLLLNCINNLNNNNIFPRRYFFPGLNNCLPFFNRISLKNSDSISKRVMCLPLYYDLSANDVDKISDVIIK